MSNNADNRAGLLKIGVYIVAIVFLVKLFALQITDKTYKLQARNNVVKKMTVYPSRGLILDRKGRVIVSNDAVYDIEIQYSLLKKFPLDTLLFCELLNTTPEFVSKKLDEIKRTSPNKPAPIIKMVEQSAFARFQENLFKFPAVTYTTRTVRRYPYGGAAHVLGYLAEVNKKQIDNSVGYYEMGDYVGITGLESYYEDYLRGKKGFTYQIMDVRGRIQGLYNDGSEDIRPTSGYDMVSSLDILLQTYGELLMQNKSGSVVAIEPSTGEVLAYISSPGYDPNLLAGRYRGHNYSELNKDKTKPLINRPISATYPPGSTFKIPADLVVFNNGVHSPEWSYACSGAYYGGSVRVKCHGSHFLPNVVSALKQSCNAYSCTVFRDMVMDSTLGTPEQAYTRWRNGIMAFGFGNVLGIDLSGEKKGNVPSADYYNRIYGKGRWKANTIISVAIGQGEVLSTPLQMANMIASVAEDGVYYTPRLLKYFVKDKKIFKPSTEKHNVGIPEYFFPSIKEALAETVRSGTAARLKSTDFDFAGKTGTAQNPHGKDHSMFVAYAPLVNPVIAIAVVVENSGFGATYAGPIASLMIEKYLNDTISSKRLYLEERMLKANLLWAKDSIAKTNLIQQ
ncbi:MAG: penicillin-binding protein 2 [Chitinophagales bacterium]|nr:penicillin-binding protein 2 [Chitinophagales bacterium]